MSGYNNRNPWNKYRHPFQQTGLDAEQVFRGTTADPEKGLPQERAPIKQRPTKIELPPHLFVPPQAQNIDIRRLADIGAGSVDIELWRFKAPQGGKTHFIAYGVFSDGTLANTQEFIPRVDGRRVFPYQGTPDAKGINFKIRLGLAPDLSENSLLGAQLTMEPGQVLTWNVTNLNAVSVSMGVRMKGYIDFTSQRNTDRSGG